MRKVPVFSPAQIANLAPARAIVFRRGIDPVLGRARMAWWRRDVRATTAGYPAAAAARGLRARLLYARLVSVDRAAAAAG